MIFDGKIAYLPDDIAARLGIAKEDAEWTDLSTLWPAMLTETYDKSFPTDRQDEQEKRLACKLCGGASFEVSSGNYRTVIRCPKCRWELLIHDG